MGTFEKRSMVLLFTDCHDFSKAFLEIGDRGPQFMQDFYQAVGEEAVSRGGKIVKYIGDAMLIVMDAGMETASIEAAAAMRRAYAGVVSRYGILTDTDLEVGIGSGEVFTGIFGHESLRSFDVFGERVNETAVIMHYRGIMVTKAVREACGDRFTFRRMEDRKPKWSDTPFEVWVVEGV